MKKFTKILLLLTMLVLASLSCGISNAAIQPTTESTPTPAKIQPQISTNTPTATPSASYRTIGAVWLRSAPNGAKLYTVPLGTEIRLADPLDCRDGWCRLANETAQAVDRWIWSGCLGLEGRGCR